MPSMKIEGTISFPLADEANLTGRPFEVSLVYTERNIDDVVISGAQVDQDLMGRITDAKAVFIEADAGSGELKVNGADETIQVDDSGGFWVWVNLAGGLTSLTVTTTGDARFRLYMFS